MSMESTTQLIKKYETYTPGERRINEKEHKQKQRLKEKHQMADELMNETKFFIFNNNDKEHVHYLIDKFQDFRELHRNCGNDTIILAFIFYIAKINTPRLSLNNYRVTSKYGLTDSVFELIICRVVQKLLSELPIVPRNTVKYDHDLLCRTGQR